MVVGFAHTVFIKLKFNNKVLGFRVRSYRPYPHGVDFNPNE